MFQKTFVCVLTILVVSMEPAAFAGKVELTTYYPAPYGEYKNVTTTDDTTLATATGSVIVGTTTTPLPDATKDNTLTLRPVTGNASAQTGGEAGSLRYSADAGGTGVGGVLIRDGSGWKSMGDINVVNSGVILGGAWRNLGPQNNFSVFRIVTGGRDVVECVPSGSNVRCFDGNWQILPTSDADLTFILSTTEQVFPTSTAVAASGATGSVFYIGYRLTAGGDIEVYLGYPGPLTGAFSGARGYYTKLK